MSQGSASPSTFLMSPSRYSLKSEAKYGSIFNESPPANFGFATPVVGRQRYSFFERDAAFVPIAETRSSVLDKIRSPAHPLNANNTLITKTNERPSGSRALHTNNTYITTQDSMRSTSPRESSMADGNSKEEKANLCRQKSPCDRHGDKASQRMDAEPNQQRNYEEQTIISPRPSFSANRRVSDQNDAPDRPSQREQTTVLNTAKEMLENEEDTTRNPKTYHTVSNNHQGTVRNYPAPSKNPLKMKTKGPTNNNHHDHKHHEQFHHPYRGQYYTPRVPKQVCTAQNNTSNNVSIVSSRNRNSNHNKDKQNEHYESQTTNTVPTKEERTPINEENLQRHSYSVHTSRRHQPRHFMEHTQSSQSRYRALRDQHSSPTPSPRLGPRKSGGITKRVATSKVPPYRSTTRIDAIEDIRGEMEPGEVFISMAQRIKLFEKDLGNGVVPKNPTAHRPFTVTRPKSPELMPLQQSLDPSSEDHLKVRQTTSEQNVPSYMRNRRYD